MLGKNWAASKSGRSDSMTRVIRIAPTSRSIICSEPPRRRRGFERDLAEPLDGEAHPVARHRELGGDAAARHHDHVALEPAAAAVEEIGHPGERFQWMPHGIAGLPLARGRV